MRDDNPYDGLIARLGGCVPDDEPIGRETYFNLATDQAEAIGLAQYLGTCDDDEYVEYFEMRGIKLGSQ